MDFHKFLVDLFKAFKLRLNCGRIGLPQVDVMKSSDLHDFSGSENNIDCNINEIFWDPISDKIWIVIK